MDFFNFLINSNPIFLHTYGKIIFTKRKRRVHLSNLLSNIPRDVVFPPPLTPTIMITAGFLITQTLFVVIIKNSKQMNIKKHIRSYDDHDSWIQQTNLNPSLSSVLAPFFVKISNTLFFKASYRKDMGENVL